MLSWSKIVLFGDSHIQRSFDPSIGCWGSLLANKFQRICDVVPRGFSGYNTRWCKLILSKVFGDFSSKEVACVIIWLGSNDSSDPDSPTGQHVPLEEYKANLIHMIDYLDSVGISSQRLILLSPPNYYHDDFVKSLIEQGKTEFPIKSDQLTKSYSEACKQVADSKRVQFLDLYQLFSEYTNNRELFVDGLHLSLKGAKLLDEHLSPLVVKKVESFTNTSFDKLVIFPYRDEIDVKNPEKSFAKD